MINEMRKSLGITRKQALLLDLLLKQDIVTVEQMELDYGVASMARVLVYRIRSRLKEFGIEVKNIHGDGYWLSADDKRKIEEILGSPLGHGGVGGSEATIASGSN